MEGQYKYMVCTLCFTYNQANYIEETLRGFTIQKTTFPAVFVIVDDDSKDGEQKTLINWANQNLSIEKGKDLWHELPYGKRSIAPLRTNPLLTFVILLLNENHYVTGKNNLKDNYISDWTKESKYQAICEGDDYWIVSDKLELQIQYLENHEDCGLVYTNYKTYNQVTGILKNGIEKRHNGYVTEELLCDNFIATLTVCYRTSLLGKVDFSYRDKGFLMGDLPLWVELSLHSKIAHLPFTSSVYRVLENSASHSTSCKKNLDFLLNSIRLKLYFIEKYGYNHLYKRMRSEYTYTEALKYALEKNVYKSWFYFLKSHHFSLYHFRRFLEYYGKENR